MAKKEKAEAKEELVDVSKKYKLSGKLLNQDEIDDLVTRLKKEKDKK